MTIWHLLFYVVMIGLVGDLPGCAFQSKQLDKTLNPWLGKTKADRVTQVGPPTLCTRLSNGDESCVWDTGGGDTKGVNCAPDFLSEGLDCTEASSKSLEHHATFVYGANGLAYQWNYRGTLGERSSKDSEPIPK